ncbi:hypothetical protein GALL_471340 [mine drainage metagenome]|uniref:Uncharacterized protein n=1 Tax=mine drainage metagenome TaxID=410659 RepID=A0A1J5PUI1_9ZZZZ
MHSIKVAQRGTVTVVNRAVALICDNQIEIRMAKSTFTQLSRNGVERADNNLAFKAAFATKKKFSRPV